MAIPGTLPHDIRPTLVGPFDALYGGLIPGEVAVLASDDIDLARLVALDIAAGVVQPNEERRSKAAQAVWYRAGPDGWPSWVYEAELRTRSPEYARRVDVSGSSGIHANELHTRIRTWAERADGPALVVIDTLEGLAGRTGTQARAFKGMALRRPQVAVLLLSLWPHTRQAPTVADYDELGEAVDFLVHLQGPDRPSDIQLRLLAPPDSMVCDVRKARSGYAPAVLRLPAPSRRTERAPMPPGPAPLG